MTLTVPLSSGLTSTVSLGNKTQATDSVPAVNRAPVCNSTAKVTMIHGFIIVLNPPASEFPAACRGVSEHKRDVLFFLRIEDSPQLAAESFNDGGCFILFFSLVAAFRHYSRVRVILMSDFKLKVPLPRCPQIKEKAGIVKGIRFSLYPGIASAETPCEHPESP